MSRPTLRAIFVAGSGTGIGKTYVTAALTRRLRAQGGVLALKPVASGMPPLDDAAFAQSDTALLLKAQGLATSAEWVETVSPWRFAAALAPDLAAAHEGRTLALADLVAWCQGRLDAATLGTTVLIEGVGGLMSPVTAEATGLDWLKALSLPTLLVSGSYLGAISHALTAIETLRAHDLPLLGVAVSESPDAPTRPEIVAEAIAKRSGAHVACLARDAGCPDALIGMIS